MKLESLAVYCGSRVGAAPAYRALAHDLGLRMAERGIRLVYGGGGIGLMGVVADAVIDAGGTAIGVIPEHLSRDELRHARLTEIHVVGTMHERKQLMFDMADAFAILPGGLGTLDEAIEVMTWRQLRLHDKPIVVVDVDGYWEPLRMLVRHTVTHGFAGAAAERLAVFAEGVDGLFAALDAAAPPRRPAVSDRL